MKADPISPPAPSSRDYSRKSSPVSSDNSSHNSFRQASAADLATALQDGRRDTLALFDAYAAALPGLQVPYAAELNPPLWELGHVGWFQQVWLERNAQRQHGWQAHPTLGRRPAEGVLKDHLFDSSTVEHRSRWQLALPTVEELRAALALGLAQTLDLLQDSAERGDSSDRALYFHRLVLAHEDMHFEAALYMAQALSLPLKLADAQRWHAQPLAGDRQSLAIGAAHHVSGTQAPVGFAFDNECGRAETELARYGIDSRVVSWAEFLPFVEAGGYRQASWWSLEGQAWLQASRQQAPRYLRRSANAGNGWQVQRLGQWLALDPALPACHLSAFEAEAWCRWAGRRLPSEAEWEHAALQAPADFHWGAVWEWTASDFQPYPGFSPHPYVDYSAPWFGSRRVLRGASFGTQPRMHHLRYRNFYTPGRNDIFAGFRSCAKD